MSEPAVATLVALAQRLRQAGDAATAGAGLPAALAIGRDRSLAPTRRLGAALLDVAIALIPLAAPPEVQALFEDAERVLQAAPDTLVDDWLMLWHNSAAFYDRCGAGPARDARTTQIARVAAAWTGPLQRQGAQVLLEHAAMYHRAGAVEPMKMFLRQVHRVRNAPEASGPDRASWLALYASLLASRGCDAEADDVRQEAGELAHAMGDVAREAEVLVQRATTATSRGDPRAALALIDRALPLVDAPAVAGTRVAGAIHGNLAAVVLQLGDAARYPQARASVSTATGIQGSLAPDSEELAYLLYYRGQLSERLGERAAAVPDYRAAAAIPGAAPADRAEWLSLAGDALFDGGELEAASDCYLAAVRLRTRLPAATSAPISGAPAPPTSTAADSSR